jgi:hypothetical protein
MKIVDTDGNSLDGLTLEMEELEKNRHPFLKWIDSWNGGSVLGYRPSHILVRPHKAVAEIGRQIIWAWQRVFRGWDDRVCWSIDIWLNENMPNILREYKRIMHGTPMDFFEGFPHDENYCYSKEYEKKAEQLWINEIDKMIAGFEAAKESHDIEWNTIEEYNEKEKNLKEIFETGMKSFTKYYGNLWD